MKDPSDICLHDRQLYVADKNYCIWRVSADDHSYVKWLPTKSTDMFRVYSLSVTSRGLPVTSGNPPGLREYSMTDRQLLRVFEPSWDMGLFHGVETTRSTFVIGHQGTTQNRCQFSVSSYHINSSLLMHFTAFIILYNTDYINLYVVLYCVFVYYSCW